jgi:hypothetical protein
LKILFILVVAIICLSSVNLWAQENQVDAEDSQSHSGETHMDLNELAIFVGGTAKTEIKGTYFSLGLDYLRALSPSKDWGAGVYTEIIFTKHPEWVFGALVYYRFYNKFFARTGPGIEFIKHEETDSECNCTNVNTETEFLYRVGIGYSHHTKNIIFTPTVDIDLVRSETALVFGFNVGFSF